MKRRKKHKIKHHVPKKENKKVEKSGNSGIIQREEISGYGLA